MTTQELFELTSTDLVERINSNVGLSKFAEERAKFEGWLKVELIDVLSKKRFDARPEIDRIDVSFNDRGIELKTVNTNIRYEFAKNKSRPITKNVAGVVEDIEHLRNKKFNHKFVIFVVFPVEHQNKNWIVHLTRIQMGLGEVLNREFSFNNGLPAVIYYGRLA